MKSTLCGKKFVHNLVDRRSCARVIEGLGAARPFTESDQGFSKRSYILSQICISNRARNPGLPRANVLSKILPFRIFCV